jgi:hypothetical protein
MDIRPGCPASILFCSKDVSITLHKILTISSSEFLDEYFVCPEQVSIWSVLIHQDNFKL